jgi:hypothetical protein
LAAIAVGILLHLVEERAGLDAEATQHEREQQRGLWPEEAAEGALT